MDSEGYMYVHPHFANWPNITSDVKCKVIFIEGGLQKNESVDSFMRFEEVATVEAPENTRFYANADAFYIRCHRNESKIFEKPFAGMRDFGREKNKVSVS
ncbi:unnamed protein product [Heligmosomoides polygyrus]|uniref:FtsJ domain-containing protein n=1 Tax=Heligmosomoides polygyrus TaxID=6339 RepID=A0A183GIQ7_HELPZ|nr:unnamed protein product [Heligmosomoides polygyrus]